MGEYFLIGDRIHLGMEHHLRECSNLISLVDLMSETKPITVIGLGIFGSVPVVLVDLAEGGKGKIYEFSSPLESGESRICYEATFDTAEFGISATPLTDTWSLCV